MSNRRIRHLTVIGLALPVLALTSCGDSRETVSSGDWVDHHMTELGDGLLASSGEIDVTPGTIDSPGAIEPGSCEPLGDWVEHANGEPFPANDEFADGWQDIIDAAEDIYQACRDADLDATLEGMESIQGKIANLQSIVAGL